MHIRRLQLRGYKALREFSVTLDDVNVLVGPNNSGKSTIIGVFRILDAGLRRAKSAGAEFVIADGEHFYAWRLNVEQLPVSSENVHTDYGDQSAQVTFVCDDNVTLSLHFPDEGHCYLRVERDGTNIRRAAEVRKYVPFSILAVPVLGPLEHNEQLVQEDTVRQNLATHRACRNFRSYWHYSGENFDQFRVLVEKTWPGMTIVRPERPDILSKTIVMFCEEERIARELYWAGFGFQVWCQLLTHLVRATENSIIVIDEPEIYLHPDVQRQLMGLLRTRGGGVVIATHSVEMISEADPSEIILIDKSKKTGHPVRDVEGIQRVLDHLGSYQNMTLTQLARSKRLLFAENKDDVQLVRKLARQLGLDELSAGVEFTVAETEGFENWTRVRDFAWTLKRSLQTPFRVGGFFDRDFRCPEEVSAIEAEMAEHLDWSCILPRKEIENFLLHPAAIQRAVHRAISDAQRRGQLIVGDEQDGITILTACCDAEREDAIAQYVEKRHEYLRREGIGVATRHREATDWFNHHWATLDERVKIVPGKAVLKRLRTQIQDRYGISLTTARIVAGFNRTDAPPDLVEFLHKLDAFRRS